MNNLIGVLILAFNLGLVLRRTHLGVLAYVVFALVAPNASIGGTAVLYEIYALPFVLLVVLIRRPWLTHPKTYLFFASFLALILLSTIVGTTTHGAEFDVIRLQGIVRFFVLFALCRELLGRDDIERALLVVVGVNVVIGVTQLLLPAVAELSFQLYGRASQTVLEQYALEGAIPRATGTFSSPVTLGSLGLVAFAVAWSGLLSGGGARRHRWLLLTAAVAGIVSLTKTFLLGAPLVVLGSLILSLLVGGRRRGRFRPKAVALALGALGLAVGIVVAARDYLASLGLPIGYYLSYLMRPGAALASRYGPGGQLEPAIGVIRDNPLIGVGATTVHGEFLGDSTYVALLHTTGILGTAAALLAVLWLVHGAVRRQRHFDLLVIGAVLLAGIGAQIIPGLTGALAIVYVLAPAAPPAHVPVRRRVLHRDPRMRELTA